MIRQSLYTVELDITTQGVYTVFESALAHYESIERGEGYFAIDKHLILWQANKKHDGKIIRAAVMHWNEEAEEYEWREDPEQYELEFGV